MKKEKNNIEVGRIGENIAVKFLISRHYLILERNFRKKFGEIDIIAKSNDSTMVFFEVKTMRTNYGSSLNPEDNFTTRKSKIVNRTCSYFAMKHPELINETKGWRIDLLAIVISPDGKFKISHYENV